jgi:hypothetical protein
MGIAAAPRAARDRAGMMSVVHLSRRAAPKAKTAVRSTEDRR